MGREYEGYRNMIERVNAIFPGRMTLKVAEVCTLEGVGSRAVRDMFNFNGGHISVDAYVRHLCRKDEGKEPRYINRKKGARPYGKG